MSIPKVFISYSHDSLEHKKWILDLAVRLRNNGIDAIIDQWELKPGDDLPHFMEQNLTNADKILMVCTENYVEKANNGKGGVGYEKMIVTANLLSHINESKVIPVIKQTSSKSLPVFLTTKLYIDFSKNDDFEFSFDELIRTIHNSPIFKKPPIGTNPFKEEKKYVEQKLNDGILELMKVVVNQFNVTSNNYISYTLIRQSFAGSRILLDSQIDQAVSQGFMKRDIDGDIVLLPEGKIYAINNNLG
jgi:hypothetical protein